jgi:hypothetical protein
VRRGPRAGLRARGAEPRSLHDDLVRAIREVRALLAKMGSSKSATHWSTARLLVITVAAVSLREDIVEVAGLLRGELAQAEIVEQEQIRPAPGGSSSEGRHATRPSRIRLFERVQAEW